MTVNSPDLLVLDIEYYGTKTRCPVFLSTRRPEAKNLGAVTYLTISKFDLTDICVST